MDGAVRLAGGSDAGSRRSSEPTRICNAERKTVIFVTHQIDEAAFLSDRVDRVRGAPGCGSRRSSRSISHADRPFADQTLLARASDQSRGTEYGAFSKKKYSVRPACRETIE